MIVGFAGTPKFALPTLELLQKHFEIAYVLTQPDRPSGRGQKVQESPVCHLAKSLNLLVLKPEKLLKETWQKNLSEHPIDVLVVASYGLLIPKWLLTMPRYGCLNVHPSDLPRWRGATPIHAPLLHGDSETAVAIMQMEAGFDTGPIYMHEAIPLHQQTTFTSLHDTCAKVGAELMIKTLKQVPNIKPTPQKTEGITYAAKLTNQSHWYQESWSAADCHQHVQAFHPRPGVLALINNQPIKIIWGQISEQKSTHPPGTVIIGRQHWQLATTTTDYFIKEIQWPGKKAQDVQKLSGLSIPLQCRLSTPF